MSTSSAGREASGGVDKHIYYIAKGSSQRCAHIELLGVIRYNIN